MKKYVKLSISVVFLLFLIWMGIGFYISRYSLKLTEYEIPSHKLTKPIRIVQIAGLHCTDFRQELPEMIKAQEPDLTVTISDIGPIARCNNLPAGITFPSIPFEHSPILNSRVLPPLYQNYQYDKEFL